METEGFPAGGFLRLGLNIELCVQSIGPSDTKETTTRKELRKLSKIHIWLKTICILTNQNWNIIIIHRANLDTDPEMA